MLIPPVNYALVVGEVYRSGHPITLNYPFLETLHLKTIVYVGDGAPESVLAEYQAWVKSQGINFVHLPLPTVEEPFIEQDASVVESALEMVLDKRNHPILVHSDKGKHRVGVVMAAVRKCFQLWTLAPIYEEYFRFAKGKAESDFLFVEQFEPRDLAVSEEYYPKWVHRQMDDPQRPNKDFLWAT